MTEELKPCPFCGGEAESNHRGNAFGFVCAAGHYVQVYGGTAAEAIAAWNTRAAMQADATPVDARVSTSNPVVDHETGNTSDKLRDAVEVWRDAYDAFTDFYHHTTEKDPARVIEADRQATRAALVAEIVAWLRGNCMSGKWRILASEIEAKWGKL